MQKIIAGSNKPMEVGLSYSRWNDKYHALLGHHNYRIIRVCTAEEYIQCLVNLGMERATAEVYAALDSYFYEIEVD